MKSADKDRKPDLSDEALASMLEQMDSRPAPPEDVEHAIYEQTRRDWMAMQVRQAKKVRQIRTARTYPYLAAAAVILLAVLIKPVFFPATNPMDDLQMLGVVNHQVGGVFVMRENQRLRMSLKRDSNVDAADDLHTNELFSGDTIITTAGAGVSIDWAAGSTIRLAETSELTLHGAEELELISGQVYADIPTLSGGRSAAPKLKISTRFGTVEHIGTQFMVSDHPDSMVVMVREGSVSVSNAQETEVTTAGHQSTIDLNGKINRSAVSIYGDQWQWAEQLAPAFDVEGQQLYDVLIQVGREAGKQILYESVSAEQVAKSTVMHGTIDEDPEHVLENLLETNDLSWYEQDGVIHLFVSQ